MGLIHSKGFVKVINQKENSIIIPDDILTNYLNEEELVSFKNGMTGIFSITVYVEESTECECRSGGCN